MLLPDLVNEEVGILVLKRRGKELVYASARLDAPLFFEDGEKRTFIVNQMAKALKEATV